VNVGWQRNIAVNSPFELPASKPPRIPCPGNQQKIVLAKGIAGGSRVLLIDEPTRGVDVGAKREIHELIDQQARQGAAIVLVSSDLPELLALSHRVVVFEPVRLWPAWSELMPLLKRCSAG